MGYRGISMKTDWPVAVIGSGERWARGGQDHGSLALVSLAFLRDTSATVTPEGLCGECGCRCVKVLKLVGS